MIPHCQGRVKGQLKLENMMFLAVIWVMFLFLGVALSFYIRNGSAPKKHFEIGQFIMDKTIPL